MTNMATGELGQSDTCPFVPPFASVSFPQLDTALLKAACQQRGLVTRIVYGNLTLPARIGLHSYEAALIRYAIAEPVSVCW